MNRENNLRLKLILSLVVSLTLGLAPFVPEPHVVGKLRWVLGGGQGMQVTDYFDLLMHGIPWLFLLFYFVKWRFSRGANKSVPNKRK